MIKKILLVLVFSFSLVFAIEETSIAFKFLKNNIEKMDNVQTYVIKEVSTIKIPRNNWKGVTFDVKINYTDKTVVSEEITLMHNGKYVVKDFYDEYGNGMTALIKPNRKITYDKSKLIHSSTSLNNSKNMLIVASPQCSACLRRIPSVLEYGKKNDLNIYFYSIPLYTNINSFDISLMLETSIEKNKSRAFDIINQVYSHDFSNIKLSKHKLINEFNKVASTNITLKELDDYDSKSKVNANLTYSKNIKITSTPTIYVDKILFNRI